MEKVGKLINFLKKQCQFFKISPRRTSLLRSGGRGIKKNLSSNLDYLFLHADLSLPAESTLLFGRTIALN